MRRRQDRRGGALLAVMWFAAALTAIAFALSNGVRADFDRASVQADSLRAYYLAHGAVEATIRRIATSPRVPIEGQEPLFLVGQRFMTYRLEGGTVQVEIIGESGKLDVNRADPDVLNRLFLASGVEPLTAAQIATGIVAYRERLRAGEAVYGIPVDQAVEQFGNLGVGSSFRPRAASIQELEELLTLPGMTPDLLYGSYQETAEGTLVRREGLAESLTTRGGASIDVNYASPALLVAGGFSTGVAEQVAQIRRVRPLAPDDPGMAQLAARGAFFSIGRGSRAYTLRATAELNGARARRTVAALIQSDVSDSVDPMRIVRWFDNPF